MKEQCLISPFLMNFLIHFFLSFPSHCLEASWDINKSPGEVSTTFDLIIRIRAVALDHTKTRSQHLKLFPQDCVSTVDKQTHTCNHPLFTSRQKQPVCYPVIMDVHMLNRSDNYSCVCVCVVVCDAMFSCWWWKWFGKNAVEGGGDRRSR